jgi:hypothetical protein
MLEQIVTSILTPIVDKLGKMTRMLASDRNGDAVTAARAINRLCVTYGHKSMPQFKIATWRTANGGNVAPVERQITAQQAKREVDQREMDDAVPF